MRRLAMMFVLFSATFALASQPGQPIDCRDFVVLAAGLSCREYMRPCALNPADPFYASGSCFVSDADRARTSEGDVIRWTAGPAPGPSACNGLQRHALVRFRGGQDEVLGYFEDRCVNPPFRRDVIHPWHYRHQASGWPGEAYQANLSFDPVSGTLFATVLSECVAIDEPCTYAYVSWIVGITGFATTFDILQTYVPPQSSLGFRVPDMPEGMRAADHFDTYWGQLGQPLDLANAHPLQCNYPSMPPRVGDYLAITEPIPTPPPGGANYVLTSVTYQGQMRAGRKADGGRLSGRDASRLPRCVED